MWKIIKEKGKLKNQEIDIWYVSPEPYKYGFATFTSESATKEYLKNVQST